MNEEGLLDKYEAAKFLDLNPRTVTNKAQRGELPGIRRSGRREWSFRRADLERYQAARHAQQSEQA